MAKARGKGRPARKAPPARRPARAGRKPKSAARALPPARAERASFALPDETRLFPNGRAEIVRVGGGEVGRLVFDPGWRWSKDVKPLAGTDSCRAPHFQFHVSGHLAVRMDDGTELVAGPGDVTALPPGHDAWVVGDEPVVVIDWCGASRYGRA